MTDADIWQHDERFKLARSGSFLAALPGTITRISESCPVVVCVATVRGPFAQLCLGLRQDVDWQCAQRCSKGLSGLRWTGHEAEQQMLSRSGCLRKRLQGSGAPKATKTVGAN